MTASTDVNAAGSTEQNLRIVQRVIFPANRDLDTLPLYVDPDTSTVQRSGRGSSDVQAVGMTRQLHPEDILDRGSVQVRRGERLSFGSYFNAFPASYWRKWTIATKTVLHLETEGEGTIIVYRSNARGASQRVDSVLVEGSASNDFELTLAPFGDGGWYWFDLIAGGDGMTLKSAHWAVPDEGRTQGRVTLGVTTFNRADYCLETIKAIDGDPGLREILAELIIVDQGNKRSPTKPVSTLSLNPWATSSGSSTRATSAVRVVSHATCTRCSFQTRATTSCCSMTTLNLRQRA